MSTLVNRWQPREDRQRPCRDGNPPVYSRSGTDAKLPEIKHLTKVLQILFIFQLNSHYRNQRLPPGPKRNIQGSGLEPINVFRSYAATQNSSPARARQRYLRDVP